MLSLSSARNWAVDALRSYGTFPSPKTPTFPPEILAIIIRYAIGPLREPYQFVDSSNFPLFTTRQRMSPEELSGDEDYLRLLATYHSIRLVSHTCYSLAGPLPHTTFGSNNQKLHRVRNSTANLLLSHRSSQVTTLIFHSSSQANKLFSHSNEFPNLRCLSLDHVLDVPNLFDHLSTLAKLISLSIHGRVECDGSLSLPSLRIFHLNWSHGRVKFNLPSLKHFSCAYIPAQIEIYDDFQQFLDTHLHQLESFITSNPYYDYSRRLRPITHREATFWDQCPNLVTLGIGAGHLATRFRDGRARDGYFQGPNFPHPLRHLSIDLGGGSGGAWDEHLHVIEWISDALDRIPQIKHISVNENGLSTHRSRLLKRMCRKRNVELTILPARVTDRRVQEIPWVSLQLATHPWLDNTVRAATFVFIFIPYMLVSIVIRGPDKTFRGLSPY